MVIAVLLPVFVIYNLNRDRIALNFRYLRIFIFVLALSLLSAIYTILHGTSDFSVSYYYLVMLVEGVVGAFIVLWFIKFLRNDLNFKKIIEYIFLHFFDTGFDSLIYARK